jgi:23S rRNA (guanosine2251-2'-O)-methyltransferase
MSKERGSYRGNGNRDWKKDSNRTGDNKFKGRDNKDREINKDDREKRPYSDKKQARPADEKRPYDKKYAGPRTEKKYAGPRDDKKHVSPDADKKYGKPQEDSLNQYESLSVDMKDTDEGEDRIEGRNPVIEAIRAGRSINKLLISRGDREGSITQIIAMAKEKRIIVQEVERSKLDSISVTHAHQGVIALAAAKDYVDVDDIIEAAASKGEQPFIIILDEISDAYNLGSILRTANAAGAHGVIIPKRRAVGLTALVAKASAGALEYVPVARVTNISQTIEHLKKNNIWVVGTDSTGEKAFYNQDLKGPIALVIGSEGEGMGKLVRESCDFVVNIPMKGQVSSLNAAVAGAIVMYEIQRQRGK